MPSTGKSRKQYFGGRLLTAYKHFLTSTEDADSGIPVLKKLRGTRETSVLGP
jgi:hypothetical protein